MDWGDIWLFGAGALAGYAFRPKGKQESRPQDNVISSRALATDRSNLLQAYLRELSNYLVQLDPERYYRVYYKAYEEQEKLFTAENKMREAQLHILTDRYPLYDSFDFVGTRPYVSYSETLSRYDAEDIEEHFTNLVKFHSLQRAASEDWRNLMPMLGKNELEHLVKYIREVKDKKFKQRLKLAVKEFNTARRDKLTDFQIPDGSMLYESAEIAVYKLHDIAESMEGYWFKDTNEYGIHSAFYGDKAGEVYESFYRSDRIFEKREVLHVFG
jgi:hypothetical protein